MGAANGRHEIGDIVTPSTESLFGRTKDIPKGLELRVLYKIENIDRALDGATDWDDIFLEGFNEPFCEFDLDTVRRR